jgi:catechol 2,3-dioxygenase-like lactoylglutathione lyase family enzyme
MAKAKDVPQFFRLNVKVGDLDKAVAFYTDLLGIQGRKQAVRAATSTADR